MGITAFLGLTVAAVLIGVVVQLLITRPLRNEWLVVALAGAFGAIFASENLPGSYVFNGIQVWGPEFDGLFIIPAVVGGVLLALVADLGMRLEPTSLTA